VRTAYSHGYPWPDLVGLCPLLGLLLLQRASGYGIIINIMIVIVISMIISTIIIVIVYFVILVVTLVSVLVRAIGK